MLTITKSAIAKISSLIAEEQNPDIKLRPFIQGGGCSGYSYGFTFDEKQNEDDFVIEQSGFVMVIDAMSFQYLTGSEIDYIDELDGAQFVIKNPNAKSTCGCGSSFSV